MLLPVASDWKSSAFRFQTAAPSTPGLYPTSIIPSTNKSFVTVTLLNISLCARIVGKPSLLRWRSMRMPRPVIVLSVGSSAVPYSVRRMDSKVRLSIPIGADASVSSAPFLVSLKSS